MPRAEREPLFDEVTVAFVGGGFAGLVTGARLKQAGVDDVRIIEKGGDFGGTWYWNRYPGAQCDTTSFVYLALLEETGHMPTEKYAHAPEISSTASASGSSSASTTTPASTPSSPSSSGSRRAPAGSSAPTAATRSGRGSRRPCAIRPPPRR